MILKHITLISKNTIRELIKNLEKIDNGFEELYINSAMVNRNNEITLEINEKQSSEILKLIGK